MFNTSQNFVFFSQTFQPPILGLKCLAEKTKVWLVLNIMLKQYIPISTGVVAEVGEEVVVELPEDVQSDPAMRGGHRLVGLVEHAVPGIETHMLGQHLVSQFVDVEKHLQFLQERRGEREGEGEEEGERERKRDKERERRKRRKMRRGEGQGSSKVERDEGRE